MFQHSDVILLDTPVRPNVLQYSASLQYTDFIFDHIFMVLIVMKMFYIESDN